MIFLNYILKLDKKPILFSPENLGIFWLTRKEIESLNIIKNKQFIDKIFKPLPLETINLV